MAFTYDLSNDDAEVVLISKVRLEIGDTVESAGVRPNDANLSDEEIAYLLDDEGDSVGRAAARACALLSREWSRVSSYTSGPLREQFSDVSKAWADRARELTEQHGMNGAGAFSVGFARTDGFSEEAEGSEYA